MLNSIVNEKIIKNGSLIIFFLFQTSKISILLLFMFNIRWNNIFGY